MQQECLLCAHEWDGNGEREPMGMRNNTTATCMAHQLRTRWFDGYLRGSQYGEMTEDQVHTLTPQISALCKYSGT